MVNIYKLAEREASSKFYYHKKKCILSVKNILPLKITLDRGKQFGLLSGKI